jgi:transcriptional regulator with XRE-family HTH domain
MKIHEKIKFLRKSKGWTQEEMADKLNLSVNGYAKIEQGKTDLQVSRMEQIANAFGIELLELLNFGEKNVFYLTSEKSHFFKNYHELQHEFEIARLLLAERDKEIACLKEIISLKKSG